MALDGILDAGAVSKLLCISVTAVHRLAHRGTLRSRWIAGRRVFEQSEVDRYLADAAAQQRRCGGSGQGKLFQGEEAVTLDAVLGSLKAQAPAGFDPVGRKRGEGK